MSIEAKGQYLGRIYERYHRAGRQHKSKILDEFCASAEKMLAQPLVYSKI